ncbi:MAG: RloB family protein [Parabacteroides sp.]|nr:RloB family protein [Parabacteroides sp.]
MGMAVKKSIAIIGEGETEWFYFDTLRIACRYKFKVAPDFPQHSDIPHIAKLAEDYVKRQTDHVVCLVDMDRLLQIPKEMKTYRNLKNKSSKNVIWIETNPCTEFWFLLHFLPQLSIKHYASCEEVLPDLRRYMPGYEKTARYFKRNNLYKFLTENGDLQRALGYAAELTRLAAASLEDQMAYTQMHRVFELIDSMNK